MHVSIFPREKFARYTGCLVIRRIRPREGRVEKKESGENTEGSFARERNDFENLLGY